MEIKDGDIFRWQYRGGEDSSSPYRYHCKSGIAIAKGSWIVDTYWGASGDNTLWTHQDAQRDLILTYVGNFADLEKAPEYKKAYYADGDCLDLNHANSSRDNFYLRKGAQRSKEKMLEMAQYEREKAISQVTMAANRIGAMTHAIRMIEAGEGLNEIYL